MPKTETFDRTLILEKATIAFHKNGFNGTSMQDLVDETGLNRSSIYNSFGSKLDLFIECLNFYEEKNSRSTTKVLLASDTGFNAIRNLFGYFLKSVLKAGNDKGCLIANCKSEMAYQDESITDFLIKNQRNTLSLFEDLIEKGQADGSVNLNRPKADYALYLFSSLQGFRMTGILLNDREQLQSLMNTTLQTIK